MKSPHPRNAGAISRPLGSAFRSRPAQGLLIGLAAFVGALALRPFLTPLETRTWDMRVRSFARPSPFTDQIRLIFLDQSSLDWAYEENGLAWPWMREAYVPLVDFCRRAGAKALVMDVLFTEPSAYSADDDAALAAAYRRSGRIVQALYPSGKDRAWPADTPIPPPLHEVQCPEFLPDSFLAQAAGFPIPELRENAAILGHAASAPDPTDGVHRRIAPLLFFDGKPLVGLSVAAFLVANPGTPLAIERGRLQIGDRHIPLDQSGTALLRYRGPSQTHAAVSAKAVIQSELLLQNGQAPLISPDFFRGRYVLFGFTAPGLYDLRPAPVGPRYPGVEIHATALDNLLAGDFMRDLPEGWSLALLVAISLGAGFFVRTAASGLLSGGMSLLFLTLPLVVGWGLYPLGWWAPVAAPFAGSFLACGAALIVNYAFEGRQKRFLKAAFRQYLSPLVIEELLRHPEQLKLGGEKKVLTILFSDVQGFTSISEQLDPVELTALLNTYLTAVTQVIYDEGGTVDKYEGDAVIAFWNAPLDQPDHALRAVRAALRYQEIVEELRPTLVQRYGAELHARIGLHTGPVVIGNLGSEQRFNYTFLGDAGNLASRLEGINKVFGTRILISAATRTLIADAFPCRSIARVRVVGRREPVEIFEPLRPADYERRRAVMEAFQQARQTFEAGRFAEARRLFEALAGQDPPSRAYLARCLEMERQPPTEWDGVWTMTEK